MKRGYFSLVLVLATLLLSFNVCAAENETNGDFDINLGFEWLYNEMRSSGWGSSVDSLSWSILALRNKGYDVSPGVQRLKQLENSNNNWGNDVYETSLSTLALYKTGNDVDDEIIWILDRQKEALRSGEWLIQFLYDGESECRIRYDDEDFDFSINGTEIIYPSDCAIGDYWVDFEDCIKEDDADMEETFSVSCLDNVDVSLLFRANDEYYIVDQTRPLKIENACFYGEYSGCRCSVTQYASWVLQQVGERALTTPYLRSNCNDKILDYSFLYMLTSSRIYSDYLLEERAVDGGWENDFESTAMAIIALRDSASTVAPSINWLEHYQDSDGSWDGDIRTTAKVLYSMTVEPTVPVVIINNTNNQTGPNCGNEVVDSGEECEYDADCLGNLVCESCLCVNLAGCEIDDDCNGANEECVLGECVRKSECTTSSDCVTKYGSDYYCDAGNCKKAGSIDDECTIDSDCEAIYGSGWKCDDSGNCVEKGSSWVTWLIVSLIIILGLVGAYFGYKQFFKGKGGFKLGGGKGYTPKNLPSSGARPASAYPQARKPITAVRPSSQTIPVRDTKDDRVERQLDQSLRKARELLGKK